MLIPAGLLTSSVADTAKLASSGSLADVDPARAQVVARWQERAKMEPDLRYGLRSPEGAFPPLAISKESTLRREEKIPWVQVERYVIGEITDWGGAEKPNVHVRPRNSRHSIIVAASEEQIRAQRENLVFHRAIVHVRTKQNPRTGEIDKASYKLIELRANKPNVDEAQLQQLFERGAQAWEGVAEGGGWVEDLRGSN